MGRRFANTQIRSKKRTVRRARAIAGAIALALVTGSLSALTLAPSPAYADTTTTGSGLPTDSPDAIALAQAEATGQSVPVTADSTSNSTTTANADGSYTFTDSVLPTQVQQNGTWVPTDPTLHTDSNGNLVPNAVESSVVFSGGGTNPLVTLTSPGGQQVSLSWPSSLPTPTVAGDTATYADVYPGVNLAMTATVYGGYSEQLIITNATAAANPALADIHFNTSTTDLTLSDNAVGGLQATDTSGDVVFTSPTATMWSTPPTTTSTPQASKTQASKTLAVKSQDTTVTNPSAAEGDTTTDLGVDVTSDGVDLVPPTGALTAPSNTYPLVIDPTLSPPPTLNGWGWVSNTDAGTSYWEGGNNTHDSDAHVGYDDWCSDGYGGCASSAFGITRTLFSFDMTRLAGKNVTSAKLTTYEQGPTSSESGDRQIDLHGAGPFSNTTTWNNQPAAWSASVPAQFPSLNNTGVGSADFDVSTLIQNAVAQGYNSQTMVLEADNESDDTAYRYLIGKGSDAPALTVTYWSTPYVPTSLSTTNGTSTTPCNTTAPGTWIDANDSDTIKLNASISSPDSGSSEDSDFWYRRTEPAATAQSHWTNLGGPTINTAPSGPTATSAEMPTLQDGDQYQWDVYAQNGGGYSSVAAPASPASCYFQVDFTSPSIPVVSAPSLPAVQGGSGQLTVTATDGGTNPSGVSGFLYNVNGTSLTEGGSGMIPLSSTGTATISFKADNWGTNSIWIASVDKAGNRSQPIHYDFYVAPTAYTPGTAGDLDGDGKSDLAFIDTAGNIRYYSDPLDVISGSNPPTTSLTPTSSQPAGGQILIPASSAPNGTGFGGALIAHEGSFAGQTCDDLAIIQGSGLHIATANSDCTPTSTWTLGQSHGRPNQVTGDKTNYSTDWSSVQQAVLLPRPSGSPTTVAPSLITQEDKNGVPTLWLTTFQGSNPQTISLLAQGSYWGTVTILSPGLIDGQPALWVRDNASGSLTQYTNTTIEAWAATPLTTAPTGGTTIAASGYDAAQYPMITTDGADAAGGGPTLWAVDPSGRLTYIPTTLDPTTYDPTVTTTSIVPVTSIGWANYIQNLGTTALPNSPGQGDIWPLGSIATGTDISTTNPATSTGAISYTTAADGTPGGATVFDGSTTALTTTAPAVDTSSSYTVSAWVNLQATTANSVFVSQGDNSTNPVYNGFELYYSTGANSFAFGRYATDKTGAAWDAVYANSPATNNTWTHLVGVFNAATMSMTLYINGTPAATGTYTGTLWNAGGGLQIGRAGVGNQNANAAIDQIAVYNTALTQAQVTALNTP